MLVVAAIHQTWWSSPAMAQEVWLEQGAVTLTLENGQSVDLDEGNYLNCEPPDADKTDSEDRCTILPLALAPSLPSGALAGGLAGAPLAAGPLTVVGPVVGASVGAAIIGGIAAAVATGDSTPTTTPTTN